MRADKPLEDCAKSLECRNEAYHIGLSSSTNVFRHWPEVMSQMRLHQYLSGLFSWDDSTHINPSIPQETIIVPSRLNCTAVTGSECADKVFRHFPMMLVPSIRPRRQQRIDTSSYIPYAHRLIIRSRYEQCALRIVVYTKHISCMTFQSCNDIPLRRTA